MGPPKPKPQMANPATSNHPVRQPAPWDAVKISNHPNGIAGDVGLKRVIFTFDGVDSEPIWDVPPDDPLTTLQSGERVEAYFKSLDETKQLIITSIDVRLDDMLGGYDVTINTEEWIDQSFVPNDPLAPINNLDKDIETIIFDCDCVGFKQGKGISFDSQDAHELGWKECPCCHKPFKTRTSKSVSFSPVQKDDILVTSAPTVSQNIKFSDFVSNWKQLSGSDFADMLKTPEFKEAIVKAIKEQQKDTDPYKSAVLVHTTINP